MSTKNAVSEKPTRTVAALVRAMAGLASVRRSTSGSGTRRSIAIHATPARTEAAKSDITGSENQPHCSPLVTPSSNATSAAENTAAPTKSGRPPRRTGDSGTNAQISAAATSTGAPPMMNSHCQLNSSSTKPLPTSPRPPPMPNTLDITPMATPRCSAGNSSRMIPNASGKTAAPAPCTTRHATSQASDPPAAAAKDPPPKTTRHATITRFLPYMSPTLPSSGVSTELLNKNPVTSQVVSACDVPNSRRKNGSAGITSVCMTANAVPAKTRRPRVMWWRRIRTAKTVDRAGVFRLLGSNAVDHADLAQAAWRSLAAFQRLIGLHGPDAELLERDAFVASRVPATHSSLISAAVPRENGIAEHLDEIERFYDGQPKWGVWIDPARTEDADALTARGLVLDSTPILMAAELDDVDHGPDRQVVRVTLDESVWSTTRPTTFPRARSATRSRPSRPT